MSSRVTAWLSVDHTYSLSDPGRRGTETFSLMSFCSSPFRFDQEQSSDSRDQSDLVEKLHLKERQLQQVTFSCHLCLFSQRSDTDMPQVVRAC